MAKKKKITEGKIKTALVSTLTLMSLAGTYIICFSKLYRNIQLCFFFQVVYMAVNFLCLF